MIARRLGKWSFGALLLLAALLVFGVAGPRPARAAFSFDVSYERVPSVSSATWLIETDVDGDGRTDLVAVGSANQLVVHRGLAGGRLAPAAPLLTFPAVLRSAAVGDLDGDGHPDFVVVDVNDNAYSVLGKGDGTFKPARLILSLFYGAAIALGDLDHDGRQDLVAVAGFGPIIVMKGQGDGSFQVAGTIATPGAVSAIGLADFDGDGRPDLLAAFDSYGGSGDIHALLYYRGLAGPTFAAPVTCMSSVAGVSSIRAVDLDRDGFLDALVAGPATALSILYGSAQGPTVRRLDVAVANAVDVRARDFDGDGALDLAVSSRASSEDGLVLFQHQPSGAYVRVADCAAGHGPAGFAFLDADGDGIADAIATNAGSSTLAVVKGHGGFQFGGDLEVAVAGKTWDLTTGDLDRDGRQDVVLGTQATSQTSGASLLGNGDRTFRAPVYSPISFNFDRIALADVSGDGRPDLLGVSAFSYVAYSLVGDGAGRFTLASSVDFALPWSPSQHFDLAVADFDEDGKADVVIASDDGLVRFLGSASGALVSPVTVAGQSKCVVVADLNRDGHADIIETDSMIGGEWGSNVQVLLGHGDGTFTTLPVFYAGYKPALLVARDLTGDGIPDLVVYNYGESTLMTFRGVGDGTFALASTLTGIATTTMDVADCDGDGNPDLVIGVSDSSGVVIRPGQGDGTFGAPETFGCRNTPDVVRCVDLDGDGLPEIVVGHHNRPLFTVLRNRSRGLPTPVLVAHVEARVDAGRVQVTWFGDAPALAPATVQRGAGAEWRSLGRATLRDAESLVFADEVAPGEYDYRLQLNEGALRTNVGLIHVVVPVPDHLAIESCVWDAGASAFRVQLAIPGSAAAEVAALDVAGRTIAALHAVPAAPTSRQVTLSCPAAAPGIYWVRVRQGGRAACARSVVTR